MKKRRVLSSFVSLALIFTLTLASSLTVFAASGNKKVTTSGKMSALLNVGQTADSSTVSFNVSGLPTNAVITKLEVNTETLSYTGAVITNYLKITSSNGRAEEIPWQGAANKTLTTSKFLASKANGTYTISFNSTCVGGAIVNGKPLNVGTKIYSKPYIVVHWDDSF
ncbi:MAG TPA: hypothetical protein GX707_12980 [Epulopiscium sp.]|nr:hypothetical protein [Candidatus Epulonipiscium sp.]